MNSYTALLTLAAFASSALGHGAILQAVGDSGASQGFLGKLITTVGWIVDRVTTHPKPITTVAV